MKNIITCLFLIGLSIQLSAQTTKHSEEKSSTLTPIHISDKLNSQDFLKGLIPSNETNINKKILIDNVGDKKNFWVSNIETNGFDSKNFELMKKGNKTQLWFEVAEMNNGHLNDAVADSIFAYLENKSNPNSFNPSLGIIQLSDQVLGSAPNVDGDGLVDFLITDIKDGWTEESTGGYVAGFFYSVDQYSKAELPILTQTNERDVLYIDSYPGIYDGSEINPLRPLPVLAHEYQHLIHFNYNDKLGNNEYIFVNEAQSNFAALLNGFFPHNSIGDYLTETNVPIFRWDRAGNVLPDYGRAAAFTSYLWDQLGFENAGSLTQTSTSGFSAIQNVLNSNNSGLTFADLLVNWGLANLINDTENAGSSAYGYKHPFLKNLKVNDINNSGPSFTNKQVMVEDGGINYLGLGQTSDIKITITSPGTLGKARLVTYSGNTKKVHLLNNGIQYSTPQGEEYEKAYIMLVNTAPSADESTTSTPITFTLNSEGTQTFIFKSDSTFSATPKFYWNIPYNNSSGVGRLGFSNKYIVPSNSIVHSLELYISSGTDGSSQEPIEVKGSGTLNLSIHSDNGGKPGTQLATTAIDFDDIGSGWQTFSVKDWNLAVTTSQIIHVVYKFDVPNINPDVNAVPLRLDDGTGKQGVTQIITGANQYATIFNDDESNGQHGVWNKIIFGEAIPTNNEENINSDLFSLKLNQNYPNPFNPTTNIEFSLPEASQVSLTIFNTLGQTIATLVDSRLSTGLHSVTWNASNAPSGVYFYQLKAGSFTKTNKMLLLK